MTTTPTQHAAAIAAAIAAYHAGGSQSALAAALATALAAYDDVGGLAERIEALITENATILDSLQLFRPQGGVDLVSNLPGDADEGAFYVVTTGEFAGHGYIRTGGAWESLGRVQGREVQLQTGGGFVQWRYVGEASWTNLIALPAITGPAGADGANGTNGTNGTDGREVQLRVSGDYVQWRYAGETGWTNLVALSAITGPAGTNGTDGREVQLRVDSGYIQWRYAGETGWTNLVTLSAITGPAGADGADGTDGTNGTNGTDGREVQLRVSGGYIQWRYAGETAWTDLVALSAITGPTGPAAWTAPTAWVTGGDYVVGPPASVVTQGGETFVCAIPHTAGAFATDLAAGRWVKVAAKGADGAGAGDVLKPVSAGNTGKVAVFSNDGGDQLESRAIGAAAAGDILDRQTGDARYDQKSDTIAASRLSGVIDTANLPAVVINDTFEVSSQAAMLALTAQRGDIAIRTDENKTYVLSTDSPSTLADWKWMRTPTDLVLSVAGLTGTVTDSALRTALALAISDVSGLQAALDAKQAASAILAALAGLSPGANKLAYFSGASTMALTDLTSLARSFLAASTGAAALAALLTPGADGTVIKAVGGAWTVGDGGGAGVEIGDSFFSNRATFASGIVDADGSGYLASSYAAAAAIFPAKYSAMPVSYSAKSFTGPGDVSSAVTDITRVSVANGRVFISGENSDGKLLEITNAASPSCQFITGLAAGVGPVIYAFGKYIVGCSGTFYKSTTGNSGSWSLTLGHGDGYVYDFAFNGTTLVAATAGGLYSTTDGDTWTKRVSGVNFARGVAWKNGRFVAIGNTGPLYTSENGTSWTDRGTIPGISSNSGSVRVAGEYFAIGAPDQRGYTLSRDGLDWSTTVVIDATLSSGRYPMAMRKLGDCYFAIMGEYLYSTYDPFDGWSRVMQHSSGYNMADVNLGLGYVIATTTLYYTNQYFYSAAFAPLSPAQFRVPKIAPRGGAMAKTRIA